MKSINKQITAISMTFAICVSTILSVGITAEAKAKKVKSVTITSPSINKLCLKKGQTYKLKTKVTPSKAKNKKLKFKSSKPKVASVSSKGKITAKKPGTAKIAATAKDGSKKKAVITVKVLKKFVKAKSVSLNKKKLTLFADGSAKEKTYTLKASVKPKKATVKSVIYKSSDKSVLTVTKNGKVTAKKTGKAKVTAYAADGRGAKAVCSITVSKKNSGNTTPSSPDNVKKLQFTGVNHFMSFAVIRYELPAGVKVTDLTNISFDADSKQDTSIRFYAGAAKKDDAELTFAKQEIKDTITGTSTTTVDNVAVKKTTHKLEIQTTESTRPMLKAGSKQTISFNLDAKAKELLKGNQENVLQFVVYPHMAKPQMTFYNLKLRTSTATYEVPLAADMWKARFGGIFTF